MKNFALYGCHFDMCHLASGPFSMQYIQCIVSSRIHSLRHANAWDRNTPQHYATAEKWCSENQLKKLFCLRSFSLLIHSSIYTYIIPSLHNYLNRDDFISQVFFESGYQLVSVAEHQDLEHFDRGSEKCKTSLWSLLKIKGTPHVLKSDIFVVTMSL